ncbi:glycosyl hydrolase 53 family protein [Asticcacaulis sp. BYS171W]|uniref:Arabinogalactan endo-beta-1,4-galactanase n=1 Tax=Asticcacaulis aquaticus TaxID=2984212 RepID=A0ABT5HVH2_9CAUL|nr:glycosyl hydrolase 53 family protein [Asticcacaulis aquaticus]MDC7683917.1 glycosyl hydrolase 53 family protein [Asticcacaulis aquaticus]
MTSINRRTFNMALMGLPLAGSALAKGSGAFPFLIGADVSWVPQDEAAGAVYYDKGVKGDILDILKANGFNAIKLRLFVNPEKGYALKAPPYPAGEPWCGLTQTIRMAKRVRAAGMHLSLTFHYSDTWADPQKQSKPEAWAGLAFPDLVKAVGLHTRTSLEAMKAADALPDLILIGNEITFGMLWPDGRVPLSVPTGNPQTDAVHMNVPDAGGFDKLAQLLSAGLDASRAVAPKANTAVHNHLGRHWPIVKNWTDNLLSRGVRFDSVGFSCYQQAEQGDWARTFSEFVKAYPTHDFFVSEYSSRKRYLNDLVHNNPGRPGRGTYIWEPTRHQEALFDRDGVTMGEGPKPDLLRDGVNSAEAPGAAPAPAGEPRKRRPAGGRYDANGLMEIYRKMAKDYRL